MTKRKFKELQINKLYEEKAEYEKKSKEKFNKSYDDLNVSDKLLIRILVRSYKEERD